MSRLTDTLRARNARLYVVATGAGVRLQSELWEPGSSAFLVGASFPYSVAARDELLGHRLDDRAVCRRTAVRLAIEAYLRACRGSQGGVPMGLGVTAAVTTDRERKGEDGAHAVLIAGDRAWVCQTELLKGQERRLQDFFVQQSALGLLEQELGIFEQASIEKLPDDELWSVVAERPVFRPNGRRGPTKDMVGPRRVILPGSFNPLHDGHREMMSDAARRDFGGHHLYELSRRGPHKPPVLVPELLRRVARFYDEPHPVVLTETRTFLDKVWMFPDSTFVMGWDTFERVLDVSWLAPDSWLPNNTLWEMLGAMRENGADFIVYDRGGHSATELERMVPKTFWDMFDFFPFDNPLSSTEIRKRGG